MGTEFIIGCICIFFEISYAMANHTDAEIKLEYKFWDNNTVTFRTNYENYDVRSIVCEELSLSPAKNGILTINQSLQPCKQYQCNVAVVDRKFQQIYRNVNILAGIQQTLQNKNDVYVLPGTDSISIKLTYAYIDCITSFYVLLDNTRAILYTNKNLTREVIISELSPCENYHVVVLLNYQYTQYVLIDKYVKTNADNYQAVKNIRFDTQLELLTWSPAIIMGCTSERSQKMYEINVRSTVDGVENEILAAETLSNEYQFDGLPKCSQYVISITPKGYPGISKSFSIDNGYTNKKLYAPGQVKHLTVDVINDSMLSIKWKRPTTNTQCVTEYSLGINDDWITTKSHEHIASNYSRSDFYNIAVCTTPNNCVKYKVDPATIATLELQKITNIEVSTKFNSKITTIGWNLASRRARAMVFYVVRLYDISGNEVYRQNDTSTDINISDLGQCEEYYLYIETILPQNSTTKVEAKFTFKTKPQKPIAPRTPELVSRTSNSLTIKTDYRIQVDKCEIEIYRLACSTGTQLRLTDDDNRVATISNLRSSTEYNCYAMVKNEFGWSDRSDEIRFETDMKSYEFVELYANRISSTSIVLAWSTSINSMLNLYITKINNLDAVPMHCKSRPAYTGLMLQIVSEYNRQYTIENLEPNTNYSLQMVTFDRLVNYNSQIYVTTTPDTPYQVDNLKITSFTNETVTFSWEAPCILNGRIKHFMISIMETNESCSDNPILYRTVPFDQFDFTEISIKPNHSYNISVAVKLNGFLGPLNESVIEFISPLTFNESRLVWYILVGAIVIVILIMAIGIAYYFRWFLIKEPNDNEHDVFIDLPRFSSSVKPVDDEAIRREFHSINDMDLSHLSKIVPQNQIVNNRNVNIVPYDFNRVVLKPNQFCFTDYINASYIDGYNDVKQYIATQGPNHDTIYDFWHMVIQEKCEKIIMLTQLVENDCQQCAQYYPNANETLEFDNLLIKNVDETNFGNFIKRSLYIMCGIKKQSIVHYQYIAWSERNGPEFPLCLIEFVEISGYQTYKTSNPIIVHSSAGAGRTGSYIALDILFQTCRNVNKISISQTVEKLRAQRCGMVQTFEQYEFLYAAIKSYYLTRVYKRNEWL